MNWKGITLYRGGNGFAGLDVYQSHLKITDTDNDGSLTANGGANGAGIGGGNSRSGSNITIEGGTITANGGANAAGIGGGNGGDGSDITISGGNVTANGGDYGAGIGGGHGGVGSDITISGGTVTATGGDFGAGIGGGDDGDGSDITISSGTVTATGGVYGAGIGGGDAGDGSDITISGGNVTATNGDFGAGIGGGDAGDGSNITVSGGTVIAVGVNSGAAIGSGSEGNGTVNITISGSAEVSVAGGYEYQSLTVDLGSGAAIGNGGQDNHVDGTEAYTQQLTTGSIRIYPAGTTVNQIQNGSVNPTQTIQGTGGGNNSSNNNNNHSGGSSSGSSSHSETHVHSYTWVITSEPTAYENGEMVYQCSCGHIASRADIEASSRLVTDGIRSFSGTAQNGTVKMDFGYYFSINKAFALAHDARADVTTIITYYYMGKHYEMTIPAGFNLLQTIDEKGWAGFKFIGSFPGVVTKEIP